MDDPSILQGGDPVISISPNVVVKRAIFAMASELVDPIVEKHGLEPYRVGGGFASPGSLFTNVEQHLGEIMRVADWLLGKEV